MSDIILEKDSIQLIPATDEDLELMMAWRSHPEVYRYFYVQDGPISWEEHYSFWKNRKDRIDWIIIYYDGTRKRKVGSVNVTELSNEIPEIGVYIGELTLMGKGIGSISVSLVVQWLKDQKYSKVCAHISKDNIKSQRLFASLDFKQCEEVHDGAWWRYEKILNNNEP